MVASIETINLTKSYRGSKTPALNNLSISIAPGEVYGFLGPNGAGKSTTIRTLLNFIMPTTGTARIMGLDIVRDSVKIKPHVGYLCGELKLYDKMTGRQFLDYMSDLQPAKDPSYRTQLEKLFEVSLDQPIRTLSKGNKQKFGLIQAFMHEPEVLILDEPTSGLDPLVQEVFFKLVREAQSKGGSVFVSSHNFSEVTRMCDRVGFIRNGQLVGEESISTLQAKASHNYLISFKDTPPVKELSELAHSKVSPPEGNRVHIEIAGDLSPLFKVLARHKVIRLDQEEADLEHEFLSFYKKEDA